MPPMISLGIGDQMSPEQMIEAVKRYEEYFLEMGDALHSLDASKEISTTQLLQLATQVKIVPAAEGRGRLEKADLSSDVNLNESQDRLSARIRSTIGIPSDEESKSRLDNLREKARYAKKLLDIQTGCAHSLTNLILKDLKYQGIILDSSNIETKFKAIQNPNVEEDAEGMFHLATSARDVIRTYVETTEDIPGLKLNPEAAKNFLDSLMSRFPQLDNMLETDIYGDSMGAEDSEDIHDDVENAGFIDRDSDMDMDSSGPESVGSDVDEPLVEPEEPDFEEPDFEEPANTDLGEE